MKNVANFQMRFQSFLDTINRKLYEEFSGSGVPRVRFLTNQMGDTHLAQRVFERDLQPATLGGMFTKLARSHICELLYIGMRHHETEARYVSIRVDYKDIAVVLRTRTDHADSNHQNINFFVVTAMPVSYRSEVEYQINVA